MPQNKIKSFTYLHKADNIYSPSFSSVFSFPYSGYSRQPLREAIHARLAMEHVSSPWL